MEAPVPVRQALGQIEEGANSMSLDERRNTVEALRRLASKLEPPNDAVQYILRTPHQLALARVGQDLGLFRCLVDADRPLGVREIQAAVGGTTGFLARLLRMMASWSMVDERGACLYGVTHLTTSLANPIHVTAVASHVYIFSDIFHSVAEQLSETGYREPAVGGETAFNRSFDTQQTIFEWMKDHPYEAEQMSYHLRSVEQPEVKWTSCVNISDHCRGWTGDRPLFVDVGSFTGFQTLEFQRASSGIPGRIICQDQEHMLRCIPDADGIERSAADYVEYQPIHGSKFYYLRHVLHKRFEADLVRIIRNIVNVMDADSIILIDEMVMKPRGASFQMTGNDVEMLTIFGGKERTAEEWYDVLENKCGLRVRAIRTYDVFQGSSIIECIPASLEMQVD